MNWRNMIGKIVVCGLVLMWAVSLVWLFMGFYVNI